MQTTTIRDSNHQKNISITTIVLGHVICWMIFIGYELGLFYYSAGKLEPSYIYIIYYAINITFFYAHVRLLKYTFSLHPPHYIKGSIVFVLLITCYLAIKFISSFYLESPRLSLTDQIGHIKPAIANTLFRAGYFALLATFYWAAGHIAFYRRQTLEAEKKQLEILHEKSAVEIRLSEAKNAYLQLQINPHMLFNSLNFIYNSVHKNSPDASRSVLLLSDIMRFSLKGTEEDGKTSLQNEIEQIHNLIEINRQRYDEPLFLDLQIQGDLINNRIIPLILFTLTENLFKHGNLTVKQQPALLRINVNPHGELLYYTRNLKRSKSRFQRNSQIGIINIRTRMEYAYPGLYKLDLTDNEDFFETTLNVSL